MHYYEADFISGNKSLENAGFTDLDGDGWREYDADGSGTWTVGDLDDYEYANGGIIELYAAAGYDPAIRACDIMVDGLESMGVRAATIEMDFLAILDELWAGRAWVACWTEVVPYVNPVKLLYNNFAIGGQNNIDPYNYYHFHNATINTILEEMVTSSDVNGVKNKAREASLMLAFEQPQIVCYNDVNIGAHRNDRFDGWFEFVGAGVSNGDNWACAIKVHLKESLGGPYGGIFRYCLSDNMGTLNPYLQTTGYEATVFQYIYEPLVNVDPFTWDFEPGLAYNWDIKETTANGDILDGLKFTYYLYENETWHDGVAFDAYDVNTSIYQWMACPRSGPEMQHIYKVEIPNTHTIILYSDTKGFFEFADTQIPYIVPDHIYGDVANITAFNPTPSQMIGTGPYAMDDRVPGEYIRLDRHVNWRWDIRDEESTTTIETPTTITITEIPATTETTATTVTKIPCENNPPEVTITGIEDEGTYSGIVTVDISATDESNIMKTEITIKGGDIDETETMYLDLTAGMWVGEFKIDTKDFPDDTYMITIRVFDACENVKTIRLDVSFDNAIEQSSTEIGTQEVPIITSGFEIFSGIMGLGMVLIIIWRRRRN
ncbi:MAG: ABC transporter substrate-binding protein [Candidatus Hodarchaeota archaeon]